MPITLHPMPALPQCDGEQWEVGAPNDLAHLVALVLVGRAVHASQILKGVMASKPSIKETLKETLRKDLHPKTDKGIQHRDGLLFEIVCWVAAQKGKTDDERIDDPHLKSTTQGTDGVKVTVDSTTKRLTKATVYEYKCTTHHRQKFQGPVLKSFREYVSGDRDN